jgi:hypothetical protein
VPVQVQRRRRVDRVLRVDEDVAPDGEACWIINWD